MMFALFLVTGALSQSEKDCAELGWTDEIKSGSGAYDGGMGVEGVCGTKDGAICGSQMVNEDAIDVCEGIGARLCTEDEYSALEAGNSGCNLEKKGRYAWTSTKCGNKNKGRVSIKLTEEGEVTAECKDKKEEAYGGRCCADVGEVVETDAPTMAPIETDAPTMAPIETDAPTMAPIDTDAPTPAPIDTDAPTPAPIATDAPTPEEPTPSVKTCDEFGWSDETLKGGVGILGVCGTKPEESVCGGEITWDRAGAICTDMGARFCTQVEYEMLEAWDSGCKYEKKNRFLWTGTACTTDDSKPGRITTKLNTSGGATSTCTAADDKAYGGRCCADVGASVAPTMTPTVDPEAIDEIMAELMCIAASTSKPDCKAALPKIVGKCKYTKGGNVEDRCQLKVFYGSCDTLSKHDCVKAVSKGRCDFLDEDKKTCKDKEE